MFLGFYFLNHQKNKNFLNIYFSLTKLSNVSTVNSTIHRKERVKLQLLQAREHNYEGKVTF